MIMRILIFYSLLSLSLGVSGANAQSLLAKADGSWQGSGWFRQEPGGPKRATKCRFTMKYSDKKSMLTITGKCAGGGRSGRVTGSITERTARNFTGQWRATRGVIAKNMKGRQSGNRVTLTWLAKPEGSQSLLPFSAQWMITEKKISLSISGGKGEGARLSSLTMRR